MTVLSRLAQRSYPDRGVFVWTWHNSCYITQITEIAYNLPEHQRKPTRYITNPVINNVSWKGRKFGICAWQSIHSFQNSAFKSLIIGYRHISALNWMIYGLHKGPTSNMQATLCHTYCMTECCLHLNIWFIQSTAVNLIVEQHSNFLLFLLPCSIIQCGDGDFR